MARQILQPQRSQLSAPAATKTMHAIHSEQLYRSLASKLGLIQRLAMHLTAGLKGFLWGPCRRSRHPEPPSNRSMRVLNMGNNDAREKPASKKLLVRLNAQILTNCRKIGSFWPVLEGYRRYFRKK